MKFFKSTLTIVALLAMSPLFAARSSAAAQPAQATAATRSKKPAGTPAAKATPARAARKTPAAQQFAVTPSSYGQILATLKTITPTSADYSTLINIRTEIDRQISLLPNDIIRKIHNIDDTILDVMEDAGGHALARHVDQSHSDLAQRLLRENIEASSTFTNKQTAIKAVKENLQHNAEKIASWLASNPELNNREPFYYTHSYTIGESVVRGKENVMRPSVKSIVVLAPDSTNDLGFRIVTAYPTHK